MFWLFMAVALIVVVLLFRKFTKIMVIILCCIVAITLMFLAYLSFEDGRKERQNDLVKLYLFEVDKSCAKEGYEYSVAVSNMGAKTVHKISWNLSAFKPGFSKNLVDYRSGYEWENPYETYKIFKKGDTGGWCYKYPKVIDGEDPKKLEWKITNKRINFKD